jgi:ankyrin repeat protein
LYQYGGYPVAGILPWAIRDTGPENVDIVRFLLDIGAPIDAIEYEHDPWLAANYQAFNRGSAINHAVVDCSEDMVELLLSRGARTDIVDMNGNTCLDLVRKYGYSRKEEIILSHINRRESSSH